MTPTGYTIHRDVDAANARVELRLGGTLDRSSCVDLRRALLAGPARSPRVNLVVDLGAAIHIDSDCVDVLLAGYSRALRAGRGFEVVNAHGPVRQTLALSRLCAPDENDQPLYVPPWLNGSELARAEVDEAELSS